MNWLRNIVVKLWKQQYFDIVAACIYIVPDTMHVSLFHVKPENGEVICIQVIVCVTSCL